MLETTAVCLVDYSNFLRDTGENPAVLGQELEQMVDEALKVHPRLDRLDVRFYGGWYTNDVLSNQGSALAAAIQTIDLFPIRRFHGSPEAGSSLLLRGRVELVTQLTALPSIQWRDTLRERAGLRRVRIEKTDICAANSDECPALIVRRFARGVDKRCHVSDCHLRNRDVFTRRQQKMVDGMVVCDVIELAQREEVAALFLFSDDVDLLPGLAMASARSTGSLRWYVRNRRLADKYATFLQQLAIEYAVWS